MGLHVKRSKGVICGEEARAAFAPKQKKIICSAKRPTRVATSLQDVFHAIVISKQFVCTSVLNYLCTCAGKSLKLLAPDVRF